MSAGGAGQDLIAITLLRWWAPRSIVASRGLTPKVLGDHPQQLPARLPIHGWGSHPDSQHTVDLTHDLAAAGTGYDTNLDGAADGRGR